MSVQIIEAFASVWLGRSGTVCWLNNTFCWSSPGRISRYSSIRTYEKEILVLTVTRNSVASDSRNPEAIWGGESPTAHPR